MDKNHVLELHHNHIDMVVVCEDLLTDSEAIALAKQTHREQPGIWRTFNRFATAAELAAGQPQGVS